MSRSASITLGDLTVTVEYDINGGYAPATLTDPEESPEIDLTRLETPAGEDISGLLQFEPVYERCLEKITELERDDRYYQDDEAYDRARDAQLESMA